MKMSVMASCQSDILKSFDETVKVMEPDKTLLTLSDFRESHFGLFPNHVQKHVQGFIKNINFSHPELPIALNAISAAWKDQIVFLTNSLKDKKYTQNNEFELFIIRCSTLKHRFYCRELISNKRLEKKQIAVIDYSKIRLNKGYNENFVTDLEKYGRQNKFFDSEAGDLLEESKELEAYGLVDMAKAFIQKIKIFESMKADEGFYKMRPQDACYIMMKTLIPEGKDYYVCKSSDLQDSGIKDQNLKLITRVWIFC